MDEDLALGLFVMGLVASGLGLWIFAQYRRAKGGPAGWGSLVVGNVLVLALLLGVALVGGEVYYRFFYDTSDVLDYTKVGHRWFERHWQVNSSDCRDNIDYARRIAAGKRRVSFLGDSFTAGHGVNEVEDRFGNRIRRAHPEWEVHLLAQPGMDTGGELQYLQGCVDQQYELDMVVLVYCLNDVTDMFPAWAETVEAFRAETAHGGWLRRNSYLVNTLYHRIVTMRSPAMRGYYAYVAEGYRGENWERQQQRLQALRDLARSRGRQFCVVTFPFFQALGREYEYAPVHEQLNACWRRLGVPHLDLLPLYRDRPPRELMVNRYDAHPNPCAHKLAAEAIGRFLEEQMPPGARASSPL